jgi:alkanesulfonate monooxygenase SsuD/methylene tetrahydromethanopterin reductase-like flavin-dependent oxidoreductase (luciferase family)
MSKMPALTLLATPGRRSKMLDLVKEAEQRGFTGVYVPSLSATLPFCQSILEATSSIEVVSSIQPIYYYNAKEMASTAAYMHEVGAGRFRLGLGVSHEIMRTQFGVAGRSGKPLTDMREYVAQLREAEPASGPLPPIVLATLRSKMLDLAVTSAQGAVWANAARSFMSTQLKQVTDEARQAGFTTAVMIPTTIDDDEEAAAAISRRSLEMYLNLPNYRNYWKAAGYETEMLAVEQAIASGNGTGLAAIAGDAWLGDVTLYGSANKVREGLEAWFDAGVDTPVLVPSSTKGGMAKAAQELFEALC